MSPFCPRFKFFLPFGIFQVSDALIAKPAAIQGDKFTKSHPETATPIAMEIPIKFPALLEFVDLLFILWPEAESNCRPLVFQGKTIKA